MVSLQRLTDPYMFHIYNTLSRKKERFEPLVEGEVGLYVCGITVYDHCHVGHARVMVVYDLLFRHLLSRNYTVKYVRNITDVDDKIIRRAAENGQTPEALSSHFISAMREDEQALNVLPPTYEPRATQSVPAMLTLIGRLIEKGHAYRADNGDVFFAVHTFEGYGKLSGRKVDEQQSGTRVAVDENKRDPLDFVLWKSAKAGEPSWESPWSAGRPGWHIECSAMASELLGEQFDIHGGGMDLEFPHHENEIAQSEAASGKSFARYWMHNALVRIDDEKMSKSLNNFQTIRDVLETFRGEEIRMFLLASHYRSPLNYSNESLLAARESLRRFYTALRAREYDSETSLDDAWVKRFEAAMDDDLNTPEAVAVMHELATELNTKAAGLPAPLAESGDEKSAEVTAVAVLARTLSYLGGRLGILQEPADEVLQGDYMGAGMDAARIESLIAERVQARKDKNWARGDEIRDELVDAGVVLEDRDGVSTWRRQ